MYVQGSSGPVPDYEEDRGIYIVCLTLCGAVWG